MEDRTCPPCLLRLGMSGEFPAAPDPDPEPVQAAVPEPSKQPRVSWKWAAIPAVAAAAAVLWMLLPARRAPSGPVVRFSLPLGDGDFAVSPDGGSIAYVATAEERKPSLWVRRLDEPSGRELRGGQGAAKPFWSPDSQHIGFFSEGKLKRVAIDGGPAMTIADAPRAFGAAWTVEGTIVFAGAPNGSLMRIPAAGGQPQPVFKSQESALRWPATLADPGTILFASPGKDKGLYAGGLSDGSVLLLQRDVPQGIAASGYLLFPRGGVLLAQAFNERRREFTGDAQPIRFVESRGAPAFSAGGNVLAYRASPEQVQRQLLWFDRNGRVLDQAGEAGAWDGFALSPDGTRVAVCREGDVWITDSRRNVTTRLTFDGKGAASPVWSPDGARIAFQREGIETVAADGTGKNEALLKGLRGAVPLDWSPDGRMLLISAASGEYAALWTLPLAEKGKPSIAILGPANFRQGRFSPDGRFVAYVSSEAGRDEVFVQSFPPGTGKWMVSSGGGEFPAWRRDGRELFYQAPDGRLLAATMNGGSAGEPRTLFETRPGGSFSVTADGQRFLFAVPLETGDMNPVQVILNWTAELSR